MGVKTRYLNFASGETLSFEVLSNESYIDSTQTAFDLAQQIHDNMVSSTFRIFVLYADETIHYEIPKDDIKVGGSYQENYQNGLRRTLSFTVYNYDGKYTPGVNNFGVGTRLRFEMGANLANGQTVWISKGVFVITSVTTNNTPRGREVQISCGDKFSLYETGGLGTLTSPYEIGVDILIEDVIRTLQLYDIGNGTVIDPKPMIFHSSLRGKKTQCSVSKNMGDNIGSLLLEMATQLSAEMFYNSNGNLVVLPIQTVTNDTNKPLVYSFNAEDGDISQLSFGLDYSRVINRIIVVGNTSTGGVFQAVAVNNDPESPYCYQRIGYHTGAVIRDSAIYSQYLAQERANYELRVQSILKTTVTANVLFNPLLEVNNLIAITDPFFDLLKERFLLQSVSCPLDFSNQMSISFSNLNNLPFTVR